VGRAPLAVLNLLDHVRYGVEHGWVEHEIEFDALLLIGVTIFPGTAHGIIATVLLRGRDVGLVTLSTS
jgi:hypothetical protein